MKEMSKHYATSTDYTHLKELLDKGVIVVCFIDGLPHDDGYIYQKVCIAKKSADDYQFSSGGLITFEWSVDTPWTLEQLCTNHNVEFIEPTL